MSCASMWHHLGGESDHGELHGDQVLQGRDFMVRGISSKVVQKMQQME